MELSTHLPWRRNGKKRLQCEPPNRLRGEFHYTLEAHTPVRVSLLTVL